MIREFLKKEESYTLSLFLSVSSTLSHDSKSLNNNSHLLKTIKIKI